MNKFLIHWDRIGYTVAFVMAGLFAWAGSMFVIDLRHDVDNLEMSVVALIPTPTVSPSIEPTASPSAAPSTAPSVPVFKRVVSPSVSVR